MKLGALCNVVRGSSPRPQGDARFYGGPIPRLMVADLTRDGKHVRPQIDSLTIEGARLSRPMKAGDVVIAVSGNPGLTAILVNDACIHDGFVGLRDLEATRLTTDFLYRYLTFIKDQNHGLAVGAIFKNLTTDQIKDIDVPLPPLSEQKRIAAILDKADELREKRRQALAKLDTLTQSLFLEMFGDPIHNERKWALDELGEMARVERGKFTPRPRGDPSFYGGRFPFIQTGDISNSGGRLRLWSQTLNDKGVKVSRSFPPGTVVIAIVGATLGITSILDIEVYCPDSVVGIQAHASKASAEYIERVLRFWRPIFVAQAPETARANINLETLRPLKIPCPPFLLQSEYARRVGSMEKLKVSHQSAISKLDTLFASLQHRAFRGEL